MSLTIPDLLAARGKLPGPAPTDPAPKLTSTSGSVPRVTVIGVDPASKIDGLGVAVCRGYRHGVEVRATAENVESMVGLDVDLIAPTIVALIEMIAAQSKDPILVVIDSAGEGAGPAARLEREVLRLRRGGIDVGIRRIVLTGGQNITTVPGTVQVNASREQLFGELVIASRTGDLNLADLPRDQANALAKEMKPYRRARTASGRARLDHPDRGHDDRIASLAFCWYGVAVKLGNIGTVAATKARLEDRVHDPRKATKGCECSRCSALRGVPYVDPNSRPAADPGAVYPVGFVHPLQRGRGGTDPFSYGDRGGLD